MRFFKLSVLFLAFLLVQGFPSIAQKTDLALQIGRGDIQSVEWHPRGTYVMVSSVTGAWIYTDTLADVAHIEGLQLATISPDGKYIAGTRDGTTVELWDALTFEFVRKQTPYLTNPITSMKWSPSSKHLAVARDGYNHHRLNVLDIEDEFRSYVGFAQASALSYEWNIDGRYIAVVEDSTGWLQVSDVHNRSRIIDDRAPQNGTSKIGWSSCNHLLRIQNNEQPLFTMWNVNTGEQSQPDYFTWQTLFSPTGCNYITANFIGNINAPEQAIELDTASYLPPFGKHAVWKPDGKMIAFHERHNWNAPTLITIADTTTGEIIHQLSHEQFPTYEVDIVWHPNQPYIILSARNGKVIAYHITEERVTGLTLAHQPVGTAIDWHSSKPILAISDSNGGVEIWNSDDGKQAEYDALHTQRVTGIKWRPNSDYIATFVQNFYAANIGDNTVHIINTSKSSTDQQKLSHTLPENVSVSDVAWHPNKPQLAVGHYENIVEVWDIVTNHIVDIAPFNDTTRVATGLRWNPEGNVLSIPHVVTGGGGGLALYELKTNKWESIRAGAKWTTDGELVWFDLSSGGGCGGYISPRITPTFRQSGWEQSIPLEGLTSPISQGFISPDGKYGVALDEDRNGLVWELRTAEIQFMLSDVDTLAWSDDATRLAILRTDGTIMILNQQGKVLEHFDTNQSLAPDYYNHAETLHWSADNQFLAHRHDGVVDVWRIAVMDDSNFSAVTVIIDNTRYDSLTALLGVALILASVMGMRLLTVKRYKRKRDMM